MKKRMISSSDSSSNETESKAIDEKKSRTPQRSMKSMVRVRKDLIKKENRYTDDESSSSNSSSDYDETTKNTRSRTIRRSKRKYVTSSSDFEPSRNEKVTRTRGKSRQVSDTKESHRKESRYKDNRRSPSRSSSASSYTSQQGKKLNSKRRDSQRDSEDDDSWKSYWAVSRKEREFKSKSREGALSSTDFDDDHYRSIVSAVIIQVNRTHIKRNQSIKIDIKSKKKKRSNSRTRSSSNRSRLTRRHPV